MAPGLNILKIKVKFLLAFVGAERSPEPRCAHNLLFTWFFSLLCLQLPHRSSQTSHPRALCQHFQSFLHVQWREIFPVRKGKYAQLQLRAGRRWRGRRWSHVRAPHGLTSSTALQVTVCDFSGKKKDF